MSSFTTQTAGTETGGDTLSPLTAQGGASGTDLGKFVGDIRARPGSALIQGVVFTAGGLVFVYGGWSFGSFGLALFCLPGVLIGTAFFVQAYMVQARRIERYERGLVLHDYKGATKVPFSEIKSVRQKIVRQSVNFVPVGTVHKYWIETHRGVKYLMDNSFPDVERNSQDIQTQVMRLRLPALLKEFGEGRVVRFGPVAFSRQGIECGKATISWPDLERFEFVNGVLHAHRRGDAKGKMLWGATIVVAAEQIDNLPLMMEFMQRLQAARRA